MSLVYWSFILSQRHLTLYLFDLPQWEPQSSVKVPSTYAMALVISYVSTSKIVGIFWSYVSIVFLMVYFASLIFFEQEQPVNPDITDYWSSLWWCSLEATTIGAPVNPVTVAGKILAAVLSGMGVIMFPLFTVYLGDIVTKYLQRRRREREEIGRA